MRERKTLTLRFTDILFILVIIAALAYGSYFYFKTRRAREIKELDQRKEELMGVSIPNQLFTLKNMDLSGQTKRHYETLVANWQTITNYQFPEIEHALVGAEQFSDNLNIQKSSRMVSEAKELIDAAEEAVKTLAQSLEEFLAIIDENKEKYDSLLERYNVARQSVITQSFNYGPAIETLEKNLQSIELSLTKYNDLTNSGDYLEAKDLLATLDSEMNSLEDVLEKIPSLYDTIKNSYEDSIDDLREGYERMLESHFQFGEINIPEEIDKIQELLNEAKTNIKSADLVDATTLMDKADREINSLYDLMESEIEAKEYVSQQVEALRIQIDSVAENNRYAGFEVDRIAQSYILHHNEVEKVASLANQIQALQNKFDQLVSHIRNNEAIFSQLEGQIKKLKRQVVEIDEQQGKIVDALTDMNQREKETKQNLDVYELDLRNLKRKIEKHHLPGLPQYYYDLFYTVTDQIEDLAKQLNKVRIDMQEIEQLDDQLVQNLNRLEQDTDHIVDNAMLTEYMIQHSNRFRYDFEEVDMAIRSAQQLFHEEYQYDESLAVIEKALFRVDQDAPTQVRRMYHREKQSRIY